MLTKNIQSKLNGYLKKKFTDDQIDRMEWYVDFEDDNIHCWQFKLDGQLHMVSYHKHKKNIVHVG